MRGFIQRHLDPADRLGEALFSLIMALGFTGAVRLGHAEADSRALLISIFGCNLAWAILDGVIYVLTVYFERGRMARLAREVLAAPTDEAALQRIRMRLTGGLATVTSPEQHEQIVQWTLQGLRREKLEPPTLQWSDVSGGIAIALLIILVTIPVIMPYLFVADPNVAVRLSNLIGLTELFFLGVWWGQMVDRHPFRIATCLTAIGLVLVLIAIALGG